MSTKAEQREYGATRYRRSGKRFSALGFRSVRSADPLQTAAIFSRWLVLGTVLVTGGHFIGVPALSASSVTVIAAVGFIAGIPHGAIDHVIARRFSGHTSLVAVAAVYVATAATAWALLQWAGPIALLVAVTLSALHFGMGEVEVVQQLTGWRPSRATSAAISIAGSGALLLPLARSGDQFTTLATAVSPGLATIISAPQVQTALLVTWLGAAAVAVAASLRSGQRGVALDIVLIGALGMVAPPLVAFAVWFGCWHALRHTARMVTVEPGSAALLAAGRGRAAVLRVVRLGALPSVAALMAVALLAWMTMAAPNPTAALAEVLRLLLALTVPHMVVVFWMDRVDDSDEAKI